MTKNGELSLFLDFALFITKVVADIDISNGVTFHTDDVVMVTIVRKLEPLDVIMEVDGVKDGSVGENIKFSVQRGKVKVDLIFFEGSP